MSGFNRLHVRVMAPFMGLFLVVGAVFLVLDRSYISRLMDERISRETARISRALSNSEFILNPVYLSKLKEVIGADIAVLAADGTVRVATIASADFPGFRRAVDSARILSSLQNGGQRVLRAAFEVGAKPYLLTARNLVSPGKSIKNADVLCIFSPLTDIRRAMARVTFHLSLVGLGGLLLSALAAYGISRSVTRPVAELISVTGQVAEGHFDQKVRGSGIEELKQLAAAVNTMSEKLQGYKQQIVRSSQLAAAGRVTAAVAHEVRNPLSSIKMMTQLLRQGLSSQPENSRIIETILTEISRLERIVKDLTDQVRPARMSPVLLDINTAVGEVLAVLEAKLEHRKITIEPMLQQPLAKVEADRDRIKQVIWNLLLNALESMPQGGHIKLSTRETGNPLQVEVAVEDQGGGIDPKDQKNVFSPFFTTKPEGLGLGLSTSRQIVSRHGGSLSLESAGGGMRAVMRLPAKENANNDPDPGRR